MVAGSAKTLPTVSEAERAKLVRFCSHAARRSDVAEDLAQETLLIAHEQAHRLRNPDAYWAWIYGIARNVCRRWLQGHGRKPEYSADDLFAGGDVQVDPDVDLELELERGELATLLDRALEYLSPAARQVLILRLIEDLPQAEVALRLGVSEGSIAVRLHRGKVSLRKVLTTEMREDVAPYGLLDEANDGWIETRIWCSMCGRKRLRGHFAPVTGDLIVRCPECYTKRGRHTARLIMPGVIGDTKSVKVALNRSVRFSHEYFSTGLRAGSAKCLRCGEDASVFTSVPKDEPAHLHGLSAVQVSCPLCGHTGWVSLDGLVMGLPEVRRFFRAHPRILTLPEQDLVEVAGQPARLVRFQSCRDAANLTVVVSKNHFRPLCIDRQSSS